MAVAFSVIIPVYNVEACLRKCLNSVLKQGCKDYEVIMVDDGSTDASGQICDEYAEHYEQCRAIHQKNKGLAGARNTGLRYASGKYIVFLDSDDYIEKELLSKAYYYMEEQGYEAFSFAARRVNEAGEALYDMRFFDGVGEYCFDDEQREKFLLTSFLQYGLGWEAWIYVYRRDIIEQNNLHFAEQLSYAEDLPFTFAYMQCVKRLIKVPDILHNYVVRETSITQTISSRRLLQGIMENVYEVMQEYLEPDKLFLYYAALLKFFVPSVLWQMSMEEVKECLYSVRDLQLYKTLWKQILQGNRRIKNVFGADSKRIIEIAAYLSEDTLK